MSEDGYELRVAGDKGEGIYALRAFKPNDVVMVGVITEVLQQNHKWAFQIGKDKFVKQAGLLYKVNHSCSPNMGFRENENNGLDFIAFKAIQPGDELVADYAMGCYNTEFLAECLCGSDECRKTVTGWEDLPMKKRKEYQGFIADYILDIEKENIAKKN